MIISKISYGTEKNINTFSDSSNMVKLQPLLIRIDDQLKLLQGYFTAYLPRFAGNMGQVYTLREMVNSARRHAQLQKVDDVHYDLEFITETVLKNTRLKNELENFVLRLVPLRDQLGEFILTVTIEDDRKKLNRLLLSVEHDLEEMKELARWDAPLVRKIDEFFSLAQEAKKDLERAIPQEKELEIMRRFSSMCAVIRAVLINIRSSNSHEKSLPMQALRKVLLQDWNALISLLKDKFEEIYTQKIRPQGVFLSSRREGVVGFEIF